MIGTHLEAKPGAPVGAILWLVAAAGLVGLAVAIGEVHPAIGAILPAVVGLGLLLARPKPFEATLSAEGLRLGPADAPEPDALPLVRYDEIQGLVGHGRHRLPQMPGKPRYEISISHPGGVLRVPKRLNVPADDLYRFLSGVVPERGSRKVHDSLADFLGRQEAQHGPDEVYTYAAASHLASKAPPTAVRVFGVALMLAGLLWVGAGVTLETRSADAFAAPRDDAGKGWIGGGVFGLFVGLLFFAASYASDADRSTARIKKWKQSSLVVSPSGLALVQGDIQGEIGWPQVRDVQLRGRPRYLSFTLTSAPNMSGILLKVPGAEIIIADLYDRPLHVIYDRIDAFWKG